MAVTITVVGNQKETVDENDYDGVTVSINIKVFDGAVEIGAKTITVTVSRYTDNFYSTVLQRLKESALEFRRYCVRQRNMENRFSTLAADLQAIV